MIVFYLLNHTHPVNYAGGWLCNIHNKKTVLLQLFIQDWLDCFGKWVIHRRLPMTKAEVQDQGFYNTSLIWDRWRFFVSAWWSYRETYVLEVNSRALFTEWLVIKHLLLPAWHKGGLFQHQREPIFPFTGTLGLANQKITGLSSLFSRMWLSNLHMKIEKLKEFTSQIDLFLTLTCAKKE